MVRPTRGSAWLLLLLLLVLGGCRAAPTSTPSFRGAAEAQPAPGFTLTDQHGQPFDLDDQRGKVVLLFFGYTHCPDVCPATLGNWKLAAEELGSQRDDVRFVFVTVDPERDDAERLADHVTLFGPDFLGLTGERETLNQVYQNYNVYHERTDAPESALGYVMSHTSSVYVIDPQGRLAQRLPFGATAEEMVTVIRDLLG